jgi:phage shock protein A
MQDRTAIAKAKREIRLLEKRIASLQEQVADWERKG